MTCPRCGAKDKWRVLGKKNRPDGIRRRRECTECLSRFRSMEVLGKEIKPRYIKENAGRKRGTEHEREGTAGGHTGECAGDPQR